MTTETLPGLAEAYLERLEKAASHLPRARRRELVDDIEAHITEALGPEPTEADVRDVLARLGAPEDIVAAEQPPPEGALHRRGPREWAALFMLLFGGLIFAAIGAMFIENRGVLVVPAVAGWLVGLALLLSSPAWTPRDKWVGALLWPGGLYGGFAFMFGTFISGTQYCGLHECVRHASDNVVDITGTVIVVLVPVLSAIYLARRA
jgi:hypothetical protein